VTGIEWTDETWNPVTGCTKVSQGCKHCYAERVSARFGKDFSQITLHPERLATPLLWKKPRRVFVNSMSDLFHESVPDEFIAAVFATMLYARQHTFQVLTKRPERMRFLLGSTAFRLLVEDDYYGMADVAAEILGRRGEFDPLCRRKDDIRAYDPGWPLPNVWLGVSVEDQATADERIPLLLDTPAAVRFVSYEPALGPVDFTRIDMGSDICTVLGWSKNVDWIIAGGESGSNARPAHPDWFRSVRDQCAAASVPFFFKQWGEWTTPDQAPEGVFVALDAHENFAGNPDLSRRYWQQDCGRFLPTEQRFFLRPSGGRALRLGGLAGRRAGA
jgi:protein gp37